MKKILLLFAVSFLLVFQTKANVIASDVVSDFDETEIYSAFGEIEALVETVSNSDVTYESLLTSNSSLLENVSANAALAMGMSAADAPPVMSAFWWGCIFGPLGIILVAVTTDQDKGQLRSSVKGCVISTVVYIAIYAIYALALRALWAAA